MPISTFKDVKSFLFDNLSTRQTIFKNTFWLGLAEGFGKLSKLVLLIYVAKILGATEYGKFSFALAFVGLFGVVASLGLSRIVVRELASGQEKEKEISSLLFLRILLSLVALALILSGSFFVTQEPLIRKVIWILGLYFLLDTFASFLNFFFQARQKMEYESWTRILRALALTGLGLFVIFSFPSLVNLSYAYLAASLIALILVLIFFHIKVAALSLSFNKSIWRDYLAMSWPLALSAFFAMVYGQIDSVIMGYLNQLTQTGWYNAAYRVVGGVLIPIGLVSTSFYPALSRAFKESREKLQKIWNYQSELMLFLALPMTVGGIILAPKIIDFIYDQTYVSSVLAFQILIVMAGIAFLQSPFSSMLLIFNQQTKFLWSGLLGAAVNIGLNLFLIPRYSLYGAALAAVITAAVVLFLYVWLTLRFTSARIFNLRFLGTGLLAALSTLIMYFVITIPGVYNLNVVFSIIIGALIYFAVFFAAKFTLGYTKPFFRI
ncbi:MAG: Polysaccharide biosynthesis protein [Parcubacteria group bacterium Gr01-1014_30]|nr:MAG: Polysaccharide biosynthesis protein [Parcubacteria group bacterium Gr01-1014_30]